MANSIMNGDYPDNGQPDNPITYVELNPETGEVKTDA
jgi:hypothetical protein